MKKKIIDCAWFLSIPMLLASCEKVIDPSLPSAEPVIVIDAWINNNPEIQKIVITQSQPYFNNSPFTGISGASVAVTGNDGSNFQFHESTEPGEYLWEPDSIVRRLGIPGTQYQLTVSIDERIFVAEAKMGHVPAIDSIAFNFENGNQFMPDMYLAEFYASDLSGPGNTYWIKSFKNSRFLNKPSEIIVSFDGSFGPGDNTDGLPFIQPIRQGINPYDEDQKGNIIPAYMPGDSIYVEIHSISFEAFNFLTEVKIQTDRRGGFSELFSQPLSNVPTNIAASDPNLRAIGFFNVSAVSGSGKKLAIE